MSEEAQRLRAEGARKAAEYLRGLLPDLDRAAMPTKSEVFVAAGMSARALHDAIATLLQSADYDTLLRQASQVASQVVREVIVAPETVDFIVRGPFCRDCADEDGVCPSTALPCERAREAVEYVLGRLNYGLINGFLPATAREAAGRHLSPRQVEDAAPGGTLPPKSEEA